MQKPEKSCGAVVCRLEGGRRLYLILHYSAGHWDLPKGHAEAGEGEEETARREIAEETGITQLQFDRTFRKVIHYSFRREGKKVPKEAVFFVAKTRQEEVSLSGEHVGFSWLPFRQAARKMTYGSAKAVLKEAEAHLSSC